MEVLCLRFVSGSQGRDDLSTCSSDSPQESAIYSCFRTPNTLRLHMALTTKLACDKRGVSPCLSLNWQGDLHNDRTTLTPSILTKAVQTVLSLAHSSPQEYQSSLAAIANWQADTLNFSGKHS